MRLWVTALALLAAVWVGAKAAGPDAAPQDPQVIRGVIESQLAAFSRDDAAGAFSHASPGIQATFETPGRFMEMVRASYPAVYRPASVAFRPLETGGGETIQPVLLTDGAGQLWLALYRMERQADGTWRISGCVLVRATAQQT